MTTYSTELIVNNDIFYLAITNDETNQIVHFAKFEGDADDLKRIEAQLQLAPFYQRGLSQKNTKALEEYKELTGICPDSEYTTYTTTAKCVYVNESWNLDNLTWSQIAELGADVLPYVGSDEELIDEMEKLIQKAQREKLIEGGKVLLVKDGNKYCTTVEGADMLVRLQFAPFGKKNTRIFRKTILELMPESREFEFLSVAYSPLAGSTNMFDYVFRKK